jgi:hypothetical protein
MPVLWRLRQEDFDFKVSYIVKCYLRKNRTDSKKVKKRYRKRLLSYSRYLTYVTVQYYTTGSLIKNQLSRTPWEYFFNYAKVT